MKAFLVLLPILGFLSDRLPAVAQEAAFPRTPLPPTLHPSLAKRLVRARPNEGIPVLIEVEGATPQEIIAMEPPREGLPSSERRARLVARLRARAEAAQVPFSSACERPNALGR